MTKPNFEDFMQKTFILKNNTMIEWFEGNL